MVLSLGGELWWKHPKSFLNPNVREPPPESPIQWARGGAHSYSLKGDPSTQPRLNTTDFFGGSATLPCQSVPLGTELGAWGIDSQQDQLIVGLPF